MKTRYFIMTLCIALFLSACQNSTTSHSAKPYAITNSWLSAGLDESGWPMFGHDATHRGSYPTQGVPEALHGQLAWQQPTGGPIFSSPVLADSVLYVGSTGGNIVALDAQTGQVHWKQNIGEYLNDSTPVVVGQVVFVGANRTWIYALDASNGNILWKTDTHQLIKAAPAYADGLLLINAGTVTLALDAYTGNVRWQFQESGVGWPSVASPTVQGRIVYVAQGTRPILYALNLITGRERWHYDAKERLISTPLVVNQSVIIGTWNGHVIALNATTGAFQWSYDVSSVAPSGTQSDGIAGSPAATSDSVFLGTYDGNMLALNIQNGHLRWSHKIDAPVLGVPVVLGGTLYICGGHTLYALRTQDGVAGWHLTLGDVRSDLALGTNRLYATTVEGYVYAVE